MEAVATAAAGVPRVYALGSVPSSPSYPYGVFSAQLLEDTARTLEHGPSIRWTQIVFQGFGRTADSVTAVTEQFRTALVGKWLSFDGHTVGPFEVELRPTPPTRDPDAGGVLGVTTTLTATAEES